MRPTTKARINTPVAPPSPNQEPASAIATTITAMTTAGTAQAPKRLDSAALLRLPRGDATRSVAAAKVAEDEEPELFRRRRMSACGKRLAMAPSRGDEAHFTNLHRGRSRARNVA